MSISNQEVNANDLVLGALELQSNGGDSDAVAVLLENAAELYEEAGLSDQAVDALALIASQ